MTGVVPPARVVIRVPATSANLGPGFDCVGLALALHNTIDVIPTRSDGPWTVEIAGEGREALPASIENLVVRSMQRLADWHGLALRSCRVRLTNGIPLGRGLGSSAAAIVGGLAAAARLLALPATPEDLLPIALSLESHPDNVVAALYGGLTLAVPVGDRVLVRRFDPPEALRAILLIPDRFSSTTATRAALSPMVHREDAVYTAGRCALLISDLALGRFDALAAAMEDRLHQPQRARVFSYLPETVQAALAAGAAGAALSGAGSSVIALATGHFEAIAQAMARVAERHHVAATTCTVDLESAGAHQVPAGVEPQPAP
jgi:homoserine kinase